MRRLLLTAVLVLGLVAGSAAAGWWAGTWIAGCYKTDPYCQGGSLSP